MCFVTAVYLSSHLDRSLSKKSAMKNSLPIFLCSIAVLLFSLVLNYYFTKVSKPSPFSPIPNDFQVYDDVSALLAVGKSFNVDRDEQSVAQEFSHAEALVSLQAAIEMKVSGKADKAFKLFKHAVALSPKHPDILTHFGEFMEKTKQDVVKADELYLRALINYPKHPGALSNRQRTASIVENLDQEKLEKIDSKRDALSAIPDANSALRRAKKEAYFQHIYHTVGIEGNTMTLQQTRSILETRLAIGGKSVDEHNEIFGLDAAMKYINSTLLGRPQAITVEHILEIHRRVLGYVDPIEGGYFRRTQVYVGSHIPPSPLEITTHIHSFLKWLNSEDALEMHPVRYAALAHYKLVHIHPFVDGNGRTSRLLMNFILMQAGYPPVIILKQHRQMYYQHIQTANEGDVRPFVRFIAECTERTLDLYLWATNEFSHQVPALAQPVILAGEDDNLEILRNHET